MCEIDKFSQWRNRFFFLIRHSNVSKAMSRASLHLALNKMIVSVSTSNRFVSIVDLFFYFSSLKNVLKIIGDVIFRWNLCDVMKYLRPKIRASFGRHHFRFAVKSEVKQMHIKFHDKWRDRKSCVAEIDLKSPELLFIPFKIQFYWIDDSELAVLIRNYKMKKHKSHWRLDDSHEFVCAK